MNKYLLLLLLLFPRSVGRDTSVKVDRVCRLVSVSSLSLSLCPLSVAVSVSLSLCLSVSQARYLRYLVKRALCHEDQTVSDHHRPDHPNQPTRWCLHANASTASP